MARREAGVEQMEKDGREEDQAPGPASGPASGFAPLCGKTMVNMGGVETGGERSGPVVGPRPSKEPELGYLA
jgi:hypothetical protein